MHQDDSEMTEDNQEASFWTRNLPLETETCFFILANALDVFMTWMLLNHGPEFQESNLVASYILARFGFNGLICFKFFLVAFVTIIAQVIARTEPRTAKLLLNAGTFIVGAVVVYSCYLWVQFTGYFG